MLYPVYSFFDMCNLCVGNDYFISRYVICYTLIYFNINFTNAMHTINCRFIFL